MKPQSRPDVGLVEYEIHLHPTYRVPCLWFTLRNLPLDEPAFNIDTVFRRLVPDEYKAGLRALGAVGGISADVSTEMREKAVCTSQFKKSWVSSRSVGLTNTLLAASPCHGCPVLLCPPLLARGCHLQIRVRQDKLPDDMDRTGGRLRGLVGAQRNGDRMRRFSRSFDAVFSLIDVADHSYASLIIIAVLLHSHVRVTVLVVACSLLATAGASNILHHMVDISGGLSREASGR